MKFMRMTMFIVTFVGVMYAAAYAAEPEQRATPSQSPEPSTQRQWTRSEILAIADTEARQRGWDVEHSLVSMDVNGPSAYSDNVPELKGRMFWGICYTPMHSPAIGGPDCIFVDRVTGAAIYSASYL